MPTRAEWMYFALLLLLLFGLYKAKQWVTAQTRTYHAARLNSGCRDSCNRPDALLMLAALLPTGCGKNNTSPPPSLDQQRRWEELRRQLQQSFGAKYNDIKLGEQLAAAFELRRHLYVRYLNESSKPASIIQEIFSKD